MISFKEIKPEILDVQNNRLFSNGLLKVPEIFKEETNPIEIEIQGLKDKNYSYEDVNSSIDQDESVQNKDEAKGFATKIYGMAKQGFQK